MANPTKKSKIKRSAAMRRRSEDLFPVMERRKNEFQDWCYAGRPEMMRRIIPGFDKQMELFKKRSIYISDEKFCNPDIIIEYGKNLRKVREARNLTRESVALELGIHNQNLAEIEAGKRKEIDRDVLLLLSGIYHICPEVLMGMDPLAVDPMDFFDETESEQANFILNKLYGDAPILLHVFLVVAALSPQKRRNIVEFAKSSLGIEILSDKKIQQLLQKIREEKDATGFYQPSHAYEHRYFTRGSCYDALCEVAVKSPELMNTYMSIASAKRTKYSYILERLISAGILE